jgi:hypothetical protein
MKKIYKRILTAALALMLLLSLSGCGALDQMRSRHALYLGDGTVVWNGETYKALPECDYLAPEMDYGPSIMLTEKDVPVLLSDIFFRDSLDVSKDKNFLYSYEIGIYYCKEEIHDEIKQRIRTPFVPDMVCYEFTVYNEDTADFENRHYKLTDAQIAGLEELMQSEPLPNNHIMWEDQYWGITLYKSSEDLLLKKDYMDIYSTGYGYFLLLRPENGSEELRSVPQEYTSLIQDISRAFLSSNLKFG